MQSQPIDRLISTTWKLLKNERQIWSCLPNSDAHPRLWCMRILDMRTSAGVGVPGSICAVVDLKDSATGTYKHCSIDCTHNVERKLSAAAVNYSFVHNSPEELTWCACINTCLHTHLEHHTDAAKDQLRWLQLSFERFQFCSTAWRESTQ